ncbi:MAG: hypothetical protein WA687_14930 [Solirubrobacterales bacterium]
MSTRGPLLTVLLPLAALLLATGAPLVSAADEPAVDDIAFEETLDLEAEVSEEIEEVVIECETAEEEFEEGELGQAAVDAICHEEITASAAGNSASACPLRSAHAHAAERNNKLKVTVGYTANEPTRATVEIRAGSTRIGSLKRRLGKSGVLRITKKLGEKQVNRVVVRFKTSSCAKFQTKSVKVG